MSQEATPRASLIRQNIPIKVLGLTLYPILMEDYELFSEISPAILIRQSTLPVKYFRYDLLSAVWEWEKDLITTKQPIANIFGKILRFLYLSLRIGYAGSEKNLLINGEQHLQGLVIKQGATPVTITPQEFTSQILPIIAEQNGLTLPDNSENVDIIRDNEKLKELQAAKQKPLKMDIADLIASVAYESRVTEAEINKWTVREFNNRRRAIDRSKKHLIFAIAESVGFVKFPNGNPVPSWIFDAVNDSYGTVSVASVIGKISGENTNNN